MRKILYVCVLLIAAMACENKQKTSINRTKADSLVEAALMEQDYDKIFALADSFEKTGDISPIYASQVRGETYIQMLKMIDAEREFRRALEEYKPQNLKDSIAHYNTACDLVQLLGIRRDHDAVLLQAIPLFDAMDTKNLETKFAVDVEGHKLLLMLYLGSSQLFLGKKAEAAKTLEQCYRTAKRLEALDSTWAVHFNNVMALNNIAVAYEMGKDYENASYWLPRMDSIAEKLYTHKDTPEPYKSYVKGLVDYSHVLAAQGEKRYDEAERYYKEYLKSSLAPTTNGKIKSAVYLNYAHRYAEAADYFKYLDQLYEEYKAEPTFDYVPNVKAKFEANLYAGRIDSALAAAKKGFIYVDSAIAYQKRSEAAKLATIYETTLKDKEIAKQQRELNNQRFMALAVALVLITTFFIIYSLLRRREARRLALAHSKLKSAYQQLEKANARAEESSRMKSDFIQQISHEIRTPLNILSGFAQVITTPGMQLDEETSADINRKITENTNRITGLVNKMLELSDAKSKSVIEKDDVVSPIEIASAAAEAAGITEAEHLKFSVEVSAEAEATTTTTNKQAADRALALLLDNARKFTAPANGQADKVLSSREQQVKLSVTVENNQVVYTVEDTGIGVPAAEKERIFEEFVQLDEYYEGTGIGLTVARSIARRLGGDIVLDTSYTNGARFILTLPL